MTVLTIKRLILPGPGGRSRETQNRRVCLIEETIKLVSG